ATIRGISPNPDATSRTVKWCFCVLDATRSISLRVVETPPNHRLMRDISRSDLEISAGGQSSESRISGVLTLRMRTSVDEAVSWICHRGSRSGLRLRRVLLRE